MKRPLKTAAAALALAFVANAASADSRQLAASAGLDPSETARFSFVEIAQAKFNAECHKDDQHSILGPHGVQVDPATHARLIAAAGLTADEAEGMTLAEIVVAKNTRDARADDRQIVVSTREMPDTISG